MKIAALIEPLESRIAPAAVFTFTDVDGDRVTIATSKGTNAQLAAILTHPAVGLGEELQRIDFSLDAATFAGTNLTVTATRTALGGDGLANVGFIDAGAGDGGAALDLGLVVIRGDLGRIDAGDAALGTAAVKGLTVQSMGLFGTTTQEAGGDLRSDLTGALGFLKVTGSFNGAQLHCGSCGAIAIGGSLVGGSGSQSGAIFTTGALGPVKIGGDVVGGAGSSSGRISAGGTLASVTVGGSVLGGDGIFSASIVGTTGLGPVKIGGRIAGGDGDSSARIFSTFGKVGSVSIGGALLGGLGEESGSLSSDGAMGAVKIGGSIVGGSGAESGRIRSGGALGAVTLGGSLVGSGADETGRIGAVGAMGVVKIGGDIEGAGGENSGGLFAGGILAGVSVGGSVFGGAGVDSGFIYTNAGLGPVKIGGDLVGGSAYGAGSINCGILTEVNAASIVIGGSVLGGSADLTGSITVSGALGALKIGGNLEGGSTSAVVTLRDTGAISAQRIASVFIGGSIVGGVEGGGGGTLINSGSVRATDDLGTVVVKGNLLGNANNPVLITARGQGAPSAGKDVAIASLTVEGRVSFADILAGYRNDNFGPPTATNADAQIGSVIAGEWIASNLVAGVQDDADAARDDDFGEGDDQLVAGGTATIARIASILIRGTALGSLFVAGDHFGFVAQQIGSLKIGPTTIPLTSGASNDLTGLLVGLSDDLRVREV